MVAVEFRERLPEAEAERTDASGLQVISRGHTFRHTLDVARDRGLSVGLVPTMGALHEGHATLIRRSAAECDVTAVTVFINPLQFDSADELAAYPSDLGSDLVVAATAGADLLFAPSAGEMWPTAPLTTVAVPSLSRGFEGASRPGHFEGVATVVARLLNLAGPCRVYFGEKDFQQLAVMRAMVRDLAVPVEIVACPTVREADGLALSSRNVRLSADERQVAPVLHRALEVAASTFAAGERDAAVLQEAMMRVIAAEPLVRADYAEVVNGDTLEPVHGDVDERCRMVVAAVIGGTRLIDNMAVSDEET